MHDLLRALFNKLDQEHIQYCLLRDQDRLDELTSGAEIDLLVQKSQLAQMACLLAQLGFVRLSSWGYAPHHFFVGYEQPTDSWFKVDVITEVTFGQPIAALRTDLAIPALDSRRRDGRVFIPAPECELVMLLLHCVLDKHQITPDRGRRLQILRGQVQDESYLSALLAAYWLPAMSWPQLALLIETENWTSLLAVRKALVARLTQRDRLGTWGRYLRERILRKLSKLSSASRPRAPMVALLAPDGAGKSTLIARIPQRFYFPVCAIYMGLDPKNTKKSLRLPLSGIGLVRRLLTLWQRYLLAWVHHLRRKLVVFDRYTYDALLSSPQSTPWGKRIRRRLLAYSCPAPDLIIFLDAPGEVLYDRKREHTAAQLEQQRQQYLALRTVLPQLVVVDATHEPEDVRREVTALIWQQYLRYQAGC